MSGHGKVADRKSRGLRGRRDHRWVDVDEIPADHEGGKLIGVGGRRVGLCDQASVSKHADSIAEVKYLGQEMGDIDDRHAPFLESAYQLEEQGGLAFGENGRGFVEDQDAGLLRKGLGDLDELLLGDGEVADPSSRIDVRADLRE